MKHVRINIASWETFRAFVIHKYDTCGLLLPLTRHYLLSDDVRLQLTLPGTPLSLFIDSMVKLSYGCPHPNPCVAVQFSDPTSPTYQHITRMLSGQESPEVTRRETRYPKRMQIRVRWGTSGSCLTTSENISHSGLELYLPQKIESGSKVSLEFEWARNWVPHQISGIVRHVSGEAPNFSTGIQLEGADEVGQSLLKSILTDAQDVYETLDLAEISNECLDSNGQYACNTQPIFNAGLPGFDEPDAFGPIESNILPLTDELRRTFSKSTS